MNSLNYYLLEKVFFSPLFLKDNFSGYSNLDWQFLPFSTSNVSSSFLLAWKISAQKSTDSLMRVSFYEFFPLFLLKVSFWL